MHYTDSWPEAAKEAFKERMREEVKEEIRDEMEGCDEERYYSWVDLLDNDFDDEIDVLWYQSGAEKINKPIKNIISFI